MRRPFRSWRFQLGGFAIIALCVAAVGWETCNKLRGEPQSAPRGVQAQPAR